MTMYILKLVSLLGGLALFLFGMDVMGKSLERTAGGKLETASLLAETGRDSDTTSLFLTLTP